jgi:hypothetical protein
MNIERLFLFVIKETLNYYLNQIEQKDKNNNKKQIKKQVKDKNKEIDLEYCPYCNLYTNKEHQCRVDYERKANIKRSN